MCATIYFFRIFGECCAFPLGPIGETHRGCLVWSMDEFRGFFQRQINEFHYFLREQLVNFRIFHPHFFPLLSFLYAINGRIWRFFSWDRQNNFVIFSCNWLANFWIFFHKPYDEFRNTFLDQMMKFIIYFPRLMDIFRDFFLLQPEQK